MPKVNWKEICCFSRYPELKIKQFAYWSWVLNPDQDPFIGRSVLFLNRHVEDLLKTTPAERDELFTIFDLMNIVFKDLFKPDLMNYAQLGNSPKFHHLHWHIVPRYNSPRTFYGKVFDDKYRGNSFDMHDSSISTPKELNVQVATHIRERLAELLQ